MSENSTIEWTDHTFNPWIGCTRISAGCKFCYAARDDERFGYTEEGWGGKRRGQDGAYWDKPMQWNKKAKEEGKRKRVFCASMSDIFDDHPSIDPVWRQLVWDLVAQTPMLDWLILTKRPHLIMGQVPSTWLSGFPSNVWVGTTAENQENAEKRIPILLKVPARIRFISGEPLIGPVDLSSWLNPQPVSVGERKLAANAIKGPNDGLQWVIVGGEADAQARPMHPAWTRTLHEQCREKSVPLFMKQWGYYVLVEIKASKTGKPLYTSPTGLGKTALHLYAESPTSSFVQVHSQSELDSLMKPGGVVAVFAKSGNDSKIFDGKNFVREYPMSAVQEPIHG